MHGGTHKSNRAGLVAALLAAAALPAAAPGQEITSEAVRQAIHKGTAFLKQAQRDDGNWPHRGHTGGNTAMCLLALLNAGVSEKDPAIHRGIQALNKVPNKSTYVVALKCQVLAIADPEMATYKAELNTAANWLIRRQLTNGMWGYGRNVGRGDNSNTQFALLGLHEAAKVGVEVPGGRNGIWQKSSRHFTATQTPKGGWGYSGKTGGAYGSMTAAGLASLYIAGQRLNAGGRRVFRDGAYPDCGKYLQNPVLAKGIEWLTENFSVTSNPKRRSTWLYYYLYGLERVGMIAGIQTFGEHDWYRQGAAFLVKRQHNDGSWNRGHSYYDTAFALLFLAKGNRPVLIQKVRWEGTWNRNRHDLENLTAFIGDKLGKQATWQSTSLDRPLRELRLSPILLITGHEFPEFSEQDKKKLQAFVASGGTLLFEACCGSEAFAKGFHALAEQVWKDYPLRKLDAAHPVLSSYFPLKDSYGLMGVDTGCRTGVIFSPKALSCLWELQDIPTYSELAFRIGTNIAAYATGRETLRDRLQAVELPEQLPEGTRPAEIPRGAVRLARLIHNGDYNADPRCLHNAAALLREKAKIDVVARERHLKATDERLFDYPVLFMTGHYTFKLSDQEVAALRQYLTKGGILVADACCGRKAYDRSFRKLIKQLFPKNPLKELKADHAIYTGRAGVRLGEVRYRRVLARELGKRGTARPPIEAVTLDGRTAVLYSKYDWSCALEGDGPYGCRGYTDEDGRELALNILLYAIMY